MIIYRKTARKTVNIRDTSVTAYKKRIKSNVDFLPNSSFNHYPKADQEKLLWSTNLLDFLVKGQRGIFGRFFCFTS